MMRYRKEKENDEKVSAGRQWGLMMDTRRYVNDAIETLEDMYNHCAENCDSANASGIVMRAASIVTTARSNAMNAMLYTSEFDAASEKGNAKAMESAFRKTRTEHDESIRNLDIVKRLKQEYGQEVTGKAI